jgi:hypothetical protein
MQLEFPPLGYEHALYVELQYLEVGLFLPVLFQPLIILLHI